MGFAPLNPTGMTGMPLIHAHMRPEFAIEEAEGVLQSIERLDLPISILTFAFLDASSNVRCDEVAPTTRAKESTAKRGKTRGALFAFDLQFQGFTGDCWYHGPCG